jgi:hypothetical protein
MQLDINYNTKEEPIRFSQPKLSSDMFAPTWLGEPLPGTSDRTMENALNDVIQVTIFFFSYYKDS